MGRPERRRSPSGAPAGQRARIIGSTTIALAVIVVLMALNLPGGRREHRRQPAAHVQATGTSQDPRADGRSTRTPAARAPSVGRAHRAGSNPYARYETRTPGDREAIGKLHAPLVIVEWADYQCPFCGKFTRDELPVLIRRYVDTGQVRFEWRDFPYFGPQSVTSAIAARSAGLQGRFWAYHDALYARQESPNSGYLSHAYLSKLARQLHLNMGKFRAALSNPTLAHQVNVDYNQGQNLGIMGTPAFIIGRQPVEGAQPLSVFEKVINEQLARLRG